MKCFDALDKSFDDIISWSPSIFCMVWEHLHIAFLFEWRTGKTRRNEWRKCRISQAEEPKTECKRNWNEIKEYGQRDNDACKSAQHDTNKKFQVVKHIHRICLCRTWNRLSWHRDAMTVSLFCLVFEAAIEAWHNTKNGNGINDSATTTQTTRRIVHRDCSV